MAEIARCVFRGGGWRLMETRGARDRTRGGTAPQAEVSEARRKFARQDSGLEHRVQKWSSRRAGTALARRFRPISSTTGSGGKIFGVLIVHDTQGDRPNALTDSGEARV